MQNTMKLSTNCSTKEKRSELQYIINLFAKIKGYEVHFGKSSAILLNYGAELPEEHKAKLVINIPADEENFETTDWNIQQEAETMQIQFRDNIVYQSFYWLNRHEEINQPYYINGFIGEDKRIHKPWVNIYATQFWDAMLKGFAALEMELPESKNWLDEKDFAVVLTHDVDRIQKWSFRWRMGRIYAGLRSLFRFDFSEMRQAFGEFKTSLKKGARDPFWNFDIIKDVEMSRDVRSTFFFLAEESDLDRKRYKLDKKLIAVIIDLEESGFEIGLHGSRYSYDNLIKMKKELSELKSFAKNIYGIRQHYLMFNIMKTWFIQEECGFLYDSTLGYNDEIGFRCGICHPYKLYAKKMWELPLSIMDVTLFDKKGYNFSKAMKNCTNILEEVKRYNGVAVILWHQRGFSDPEMVGFYEKLLDWIETNNGKVLKANAVVELFSESE